LRKENIRADLKFPMRLFEKKQKKKHQSVSLKGAREQQFDLEGE